MEAIVVTRNAVLITGAVTATDPAQRRMSSGLNTGDHSIHRLALTGRIDQLYFQDNQPQIILRQFITFQTTNSGFHH